LGEAAEKPLAGVSYPSVALFRSGLGSLWFIPIPKGRNESIVLARTWVVPGRLLSKVYPTERPVGNSSDILKFNARKGLG
jgi:hypothetical protein